MSSKSDLVLSRETYPEPSTKAGVHALVLEILNMPGACSKIVIESGQPVRVSRWTERNELMEGDVTLDAALNHAQFVEYINKAHDLSPFETVWDMVAAVRNENHHPVCWATGLDQTGLLERWFRFKDQGRPFNLEEMLLLPIRRLKSLPEDTLLLCGAPFKEGEEKDVTFVVKTAAEVRDDHEQIKQDADRVGNHSEERTPADGEVAGGGGGSFGKSWEAPGFIRARFGGGPPVR